MSKSRFKSLWYVIGVLALANLAVGVALAQSKPVDFEKLYFFDVGQGDAIYLRTLEGNDVLIDSGPGDAVVSKLGQAMPLLDRTIELAILTHPHADHISGMIEVLKRYRVEKILLPDVDYDSQTYKELLALLNEKKVQILRPKLGERLVLDHSTTFDIFYPISPRFFQAPKDINDASIAGRLSFGQNRVMLTGDAGKDIEQLFLQLKLPLASQILKVGHHGSKHSTSPEFVNAVSSTYAVISVGKNSYGHPSPETLEVLASSGQKVLRTDLEGDVVFSLYPDHLVLKNQD